jgi:hypothetical protein
MKKTKTEVKPDLLDAVIEKSQIKDFVPIYKVENAPTTMLTYYDYKINSNKIQSNISLEFSQKFIELSENISSVQYTRTQEKELNRWGIDIKTKLKLVILEEQINSIKRNFVNLIFNLASKNRLESRLSYYNRILKFIKGICKKDHKIYTEIENNYNGYKTIKNCILSASNQIFQKGR